MNASRTSEASRIVITSPVLLIALASADDLAKLTGPGIPVEIPDVVYWEAALGASSARVVVWANANQDLVRFAPTRAGVTYIRLLGKRRASELCEAAVLDTIERFPTEKLLRVSTPDWDVEP